MMIQCDCGAFQAELTHFPAHTPGRLVCYCRDCQTYLERLGREDLLDSHGGTEIVPVYPAEIRITKGQDQLICDRITPKGPFRWSTRCCNSPIGNTRPGFPWAGLFHSVFRAADPAMLERLGPIRSRIQGRDARGNPSFPIAASIGFKDMLTVLPFLARGKIAGKHRNSPFFGPDHVTPIIPPRMT